MEVGQARSMYESFDANDLIKLQRQLPAFPSDEINSRLDESRVDFDSFDIGSIPRKFIKYFSIMNVMSDGQLYKKQLLDIGCGLGVILAQANSLGMVPVGIDNFEEYDSKAYEIAKAILLSYGVASEDIDSILKYGNAENIDKELVGKFDFTISVGMLEHIYCKKSRKLIVRNMMDSLAPGGALLLVCGPNKFFPFDFNHYGPRFLFYHWLSNYWKSLYLKLFAKEEQCKDPKWLNGLKTTEIVEDIKEACPDASITNGFPLLVKLAYSRQWLKKEPFQTIAFMTAKMAAAIHVEPVIFIIARKPT